MDIGLGLGLNWELRYILNISTYFSLKYKQIVDYFWGFCIIICVFCKILLFNITKIERRYCGNGTNSLWFGTMWCLGMF